MSASVNPVSAEELAFSDQAARDSGTVEYHATADHSRMHHRLYYHLVWTTRDRAPLIDAGLAGFLCRFLRAMAARESAQILEIGIVATHVHLLLRTEPVTELPRLIQSLKGASSRLGRKEGHSTSGKQLRWAQGYSLETVGQRQLQMVRDYLRRQPLHHPAEAISGWSGDIGGAETGP